MQHSKATVVRLYFIVNWHVSIQISLEVSLSLTLLVYWREFLLKICLKMNWKMKRKIQFNGQTGIVVLNVLNSTKLANIQFQQK